MAYTQPGFVVAPQRRWSMVEVLLDKGEGKPSYAMGLWDRRKVIVFRWNGSENAPGGNPQSHGHPTWIVLDDDLYPAVIAMLPVEKREFARRYLELAA